jgi:hypothetical protein
MANSFNYSRIGIRSLIAPARRGGAVRGSDTSTELMAAIQSDTAASE